MERGRAIDPDGVALAESRRLTPTQERQASRILDGLSSDLARVVGRSRAATSQHLKVLRDIDAVTLSRQGNVVRYRISERGAGETLRQLVRCLDRLASP